MFAKGGYVQFVMAYYRRYLWKVELLQTNAEGNKYAFSCLARRQFENMVLLNGKVFRIAHSQPLKEFIKYGSVFFIVLSYFCGVYHFHYH